MMIVSVWRSGGEFDGERTFDIRMMFKIYNCMYIVAVVLYIAH